MKIYDLILYNGEDIIDLRLKLCSKIIEKFIIVEFDRTHQGQKKDYKFKINAFKDFKNKIIYKKKSITDTQNLKFKSSWDREIYQRNSLIEGVNIEDNDLIILSDVDEIIDPNRINLNLDTVSLYECLNFRFYGNYINLTNPYWPIPISTTYKIAKKVGLQNLRKTYMAYKKGRKYNIYRKNIDNNNIKLIKKSGWHFSSLKKKNEDLLETILDKHKSYSHTEFNNKYFNNKKLLQFKIMNNLDIYNQPYLWGSIDNIINNNTINNWLSNRGLIVRINKFNIEPTYNNNSYIFYRFKIFFIHKINLLISFFFLKFKT